MELRFNDAERAFRQEVRDFIARELPAETRERMVAGKSPTKDMVVDWQRKLNAKGWAVPEWPEEWGGPNWTLGQRYIFREELQQAPAPQPLSIAADAAAWIPPPQGLPMAFLDPVDDPLGEPERLEGLDAPGLDAVGLAVREGDHYVVNGQKTWTTLAQHADWIFLLARTDPNAKKQEGISFLVADMRSPGITVRPIITIEGGHEVNEVFFDDVKVPADQLIGEENRGWDCAKFLLGNERFGQARVGASRERIRRLKAIASTESMDGGKPLMQDPDFARKVAEIEVELKALEMTVMRVIASESKRKDRKPDPATSVLKIKGTEIQQMCSELLMKAAGPYAWVDGDPDTEGANEVDVAPDWAFGLAGVYFNWRKQSIYGGSNEIQRNIMAKAFLGL